MISTETIAEQFDDLGLEPSAAILERCVHLCNEHNITDAVEFVERWVAFSLSHLNGADPTLDNLNELERKEFANLKHAKNKAAANKPDHNSSSYDDYPDDDIMDSYGFHTPKNINNCLVLNPGRVAPLSGGGTFARVVVTQSEVETPLMNYVACQIIRV